eukprot:171753-Rhodomonas_salina.5
MYPDLGTRTAGVPAPNAVFLNLNLYPSSPFKPNRSMLLPSGSCVSIQAHVSLHLSSHAFLLLSPCREC